MNISWTSWARELPGLHPTAKLIVYELAILADIRGVAIVPLDHLKEVTSRSAPAVRSALKLLEERGHLLRDGPVASPFRGYRFQLLRAGAEPVPSARPCANPGAAGIQKGNPLTEEAKLRDLLLRAAAHGWEGQSAWDVAATLEKFGPARFRGIINRRWRSGAASDPWDTLTLAWEVARTQTQALVAAKDAWGLWAHMVSIAAAREDRLTEDPILVGEGQILEGLAASAMLPDQGDGRGRLSIGVDDFETQLLTVVETLMKAGLKEPIAWAGTARILELVDSGKSRRHWLAGRDAKLQALGISEKAARTWMTMLVGSRRGREGLLVGGDVNLPEQAQAIAAAM